MWELWIYCCLQKQRNDRARDFYAASLLKIFLIISLCSMTAISCKWLVQGQTQGREEKEEQLGCGWKGKDVLTGGMQRQPWIVSPLQAWTFVLLFPFSFFIFIFQVRTFVIKWRRTCSKQSFAGCMVLNVFFSWTSKTFSIQVSPAVISVKSKPLLLRPSCSAVFPRPLRVRSVF